ncbi:SCP2 domain-containing protein [Bowmanella sp. JS7-9]|uniref:Ubiquinone biosynthesis accessory factor UbiJ n=1 Tax=Pseudobowmanella zhangzhouensis TaxID=1537679 RepID=A0ABW1XRF3_9ALTE|nr:SCP2 sterol-binding domain-containing protein [Bowmanella sp. JS7-9]TBX23814.1 hypothetical protein TK45_06970 [Bowmanella sp. JS7-9]
MPALQLLSATLESAINRVLALDENSAKRLRPLAGKRLALHLQELSQPLLFVFSQRIDILVCDDEPDCLISLSMSTLPQLTDSSQLTELIRQQKLSVRGDMQLAQDISALFKELDIDWQEHVSRYTGDVVAHHLGRVVRDGSQWLSNKAALVKRQLRDALAEEKPVLVPKGRQLQFNRDLDALTKRTEALDKRIAALSSVKESV